MYSYGFPYPSVDIGQVNSEQEAVNAYVAAGKSKIMFMVNDQSVFVKSVSMNGQTSMDVFDRRTSVPAAPEYVTKEDLALALEALKTGKEAAK